jgi:hypothetical protein
MSIENVLWGAPRIQGELLKLGFVVAQSTVARLSVLKTLSTCEAWRLRHSWIASNYGRADGSMDYCFADVPSPSRRASAGINHPAPSACCAAANWYTSSLFSPR